jgi:hypothetical protein
LQIVAGVGHVHERANPALVLIGGEQNNAGFRFRNAQFNPALLIVERLVGNDGESQFLGVKIERPILIRHRDTDKFYLFDHVQSVGRTLCRRPASRTFPVRKVLSVYRYSMQNAMVPRFHQTVPIDDYVLDVLMRDIVGHDQQPAAFLIYLYLSGRAARQRWRPVNASLRMLADETGLSKSAVQSALATLHFRQLVKTSRAHSTSVPAHRVLRHWRSHRRRSAN